MLGSTLIRYQVVEVREPSEKRLLAAPWMMKPFHHEELAVKSVMGLIQEGAGCRHLRVCEHRIPTRLLVLEPPPDTLPIDHPCFLSHVVSKMAEPLTERKHAQALGFCRKVRFLGKTQKSGVSDSMTYRLSNSRKSNFATEP